VGRTLTAETEEENAMSTSTPKEVLESMRDWVNAGDLASMMSLYEPSATAAQEPGTLLHGAAAIQDNLADFIAMDGTLDLEVARVLQADDIALVIVHWTFDGVGTNGEPVAMRSRSSDVRRRQEDGTWRFVIDNPWGTD
jgi:ketosteroid isomerase-like protein